MTGDAPGTGPMPRPDWELARHWVKVSIATFGVGVFLPCLSCTANFVQGAWRNPQTLPFFLSVLAALLLCWALVAMAILGWPLVALRMPRLERGWLGFLFAGAILQGIHFVAMFVIAFLMSGTLFIGGPHDMGGGVLIALFAAVGPSFPAMWLGFVAPRVFSTRLPMGAFLTRAKP